MHPITLNQRLNDITVLDRFKDATTTDDVISYEQMRERHNHLIRWAVEQQNPQEAEVQHVDARTQLTDFWYYAYSSRSQVVKFNQPPTRYRQSNRSDHSSDAIG